VSLRGDPHLFIGLAAVHGTHIIPFSLKTTNLRAYIS
jgi:hypothetical protein